MIVTPPPAVSEGFRAALRLEAAPVLGCSDVWGLPGPKPPTLNPKPKS